MGPGTARAHLENCTGKKLISAKKSERRSRKIPVRSDGLEDRTQIKEQQSPLNSLRRVVVENWQTICEIGASDERRARV